MYPHTIFSQRVDAGIRRVGEVLSWIWLLLLLTIVVNVVLRYAFSEGRIELEELQWHLYSIGFLVGMSYAYQADAHVRVDVLHERMSPRLRAWVELYGILLLLIPFITLLVIYGIPFVISSWNLSEVSSSPGGLPMRWAIKAALPCGFILLGLSVLARLSRVWSFLFLKDAPHAG
ncbi:MAG: TRAP transporter small permease subunit [Pseudomonadales bacterium]|nr:TRAP transporter small permease subunit [Pseudomonadales bacterium]